MSDPSTRRIPKYVDDNGVPTGRAATSPVENKQRAQVIVPGRIVVPVVFVPGIMGSNLRNTQTSENVWDADSQGSLWLQWHNKGAIERQELLNPDTTTVDPDGQFYGQSATVPNEAVAKKRGWGTASQSFYGDFVVWLDNQLNPDFGENGTDESPWTSFEDAPEWGRGLFEDHEAVTIDGGQTERPFEPLMEDASKKIWNEFFCPVHVVGYNWLQSNGESGQHLAEEISRIIDHWDDAESEQGYGYKCRQVILVTHSMGGLTARAAVHEQFGNVEAKVAGIVHGEQPANGAAAAYHHCRSGYGLPTGWVLGNNAAEVTAVFANSPGAMELLPNHQYCSGSDNSRNPAQNAWLVAQTSNEGERLLSLPETDPYSEIYLKQNHWWRLVDPSLLDPAKRQDKSASWGAYIERINGVERFHRRVATYYHPQTYVHYGADAQEFPAYGDLIWQSIDPNSWSWAWFNCNPTPSIDVSKPALRGAVVAQGSDPVTIRTENGQVAAFTIKAADSIGYFQPGDGTVPACSGEAPNLQGGSAIKQSFRLNGFEHSAAYDDGHVRQATLYSIGKILEHLLENTKSP